MLVDVFGRAHVVDLLAPQYPDVDFIVPHFGSYADDWRVMRRVIDQIARYPNVYSTFSHLNVKDAAKGKSTPRDFFQTVVDRFGANRLMWASFFPAYKASAEAPVKGLIDYVRAELAFLGQTDLDWVLGETARSLFLSRREAVVGSTQ